MVEDLLLVGVVDAPRIDDRVKTLDPLHAYAQQFRLPRGLVLRDGKSLVKKDTVAGAIQIEKGQG